MSDAQILIPRELLQVWLAFGDDAPMAPSTRRYMERRFGADLRDVRIHTGAVAARLCDTLKARALTLDNNILFADGEYEPASAEGKWLLAHELAHVLQQRAARSMPRPEGKFIAFGGDDDDCEHEADRLASEVLDGGLRSYVTPDRSGVIRGTRRIGGDAEPAQVPQKVCRTISSVRGGKA